MGVFDFEANTALAIIFVNATEASMVYLKACKGMPYD